MRFLTTTLFLFFIISTMDAKTYHHFFKGEGNITKEWENVTDHPFKELLISWNSERPSRGAYEIYFQVETDKGTSPWLLYATWGAKGQRGNYSCFEEGDVRVFQDTIMIKEGSLAKSFHIQIKSREGADLTPIRSLHVYADEIGEEKFSSVISRAQSYFVHVPRLSQMSLPTKHANRLCSPTSTCAAVRRLSHDHNLDPLEFADNVWDERYDIFGNWVFNVSHAASLLGPNWTCWVEKQKNFDQVLSLLSTGSPVVISVKGPLPRSAQPYAEGHLLVIIGYDAREKEVICMDPAFPSDEKTYVRYKYDDLIKAWERREYVAYIFQRTPFVK